MASEGTQAHTSREVKLNPSRSELAEKAGVTWESAAIVDAEVRDGDLYVTVSGEKDLQKATHRLPEELR